MTKRGNNDIIILLGLKGIMQVRFGKMEIG